MARLNQITPKFSFPYVETIINDYSQVDNSLDTSSDDTVKYVIPFISGKGIDNVFVKKTDVESCIATYGDSNYKKYGQPLMQALAVLNQPNTSVWCMRVMPENATYANAIVSLYYKIDPKSKFPDSPSKRKFRVKFTVKSVADVKSQADFEAAIKALDGVPAAGKVYYVDAEGYRQSPFMGLRSSGRGKYGNNYCTRITPDNAYEKDYGIKLYSFDTLTIDGGLTRVSNYIGSLFTSSRYNSATLINDILDDTEPGVAPVVIKVDEDALEKVYNKYVAFVEEQHELLQEEYVTKLASYGLTEAMVDGTEAAPPGSEEHIAELVNIRALIEASKENNIPDDDQFDILYGLKVNTTTQALPFIYYPQPAGPDVDTLAPDYDADDYTTNTDMPSFSSTKGITFTAGSDGYFDAPRLVPNPEDDGATQWTKQDEINLCYQNAFNGTYDRKILAPKRIACSAFFDANYDLPVKNTMVDLALMRNDCLVYIDTGVEINSLSGTTLTALIDDYAAFNDRLISKNLQWYLVKEQSTKKRVKVSISYFLSQRYAYHVKTYGAHVPFVKAYAQLSGHVKDSLQPSIEGYESDLKEKLVQNRFNYFETVQENVFQRATQTTSQVTETDLSEESNVTTLYEIKRLIEDDIQARLYDFTDESTRASFRNYEVAAFASWVGNRIESIDIDFRANAWESEHSILHAYLTIVFRGLQKRAIVELDINKRTYENTEAVNDSGIID